MEGELFKTPQNKTTLALWWKLANKTCAFEFSKRKKGNIICLRFYGRFLSISSITSARTMIIRTKSPAIAGIK